MMGNVENLPKWARERIRQLERRSEELTERVLQLCEPESIPDTDTVVHNYGGPDRRLPRGSTIRFGDGSTEIDVRMSQDTLEVRSNNGMLSVAPRVSNVVEIRADR